MMPGYIYAPAPSSYVTEIRSKIRPTIFRPVCLQVSAVLKKKNHM